MKKSVAKFCLIMSVCIHNMHAQTETYKADIMKACSSLLGSSTYSVQLDYRLFLDDDRSSPFQTRKVVMIKNKKNMYVRQNNDVEFVRMGRYVVFLDHKKKMISVKGGRENAGGSDNNRQVLGEVSQALDSLVKTTTKIEKIADTHETIKYRCQFRPESLYKIAIIEIDKRTGFYKTLTTSYKHPLKVRELKNENHFVTIQINYSGFTVDPEIRAETFEVNNYLVLREGTIVSPSQQYRQYEYFNN